MSMNDIGPKRVYDLFKTAIHANIRACNLSKVPDRYASLIERRFQATWESIEQRHD